MRIDLVNNQIICPIYEGIYKGDGSVFPAKRTSEGTVIFESKVDHTQIEQSTNDYTTLQVNRTIKTEDYKLLYGGGSWESEGFIAIFTPNEQLIWLLYLENNEEFLEAIIKTNAIIAKSGSYPDLYLYNIPIDAPEKMNIVYRKENA